MATRGSCCPGDVELPSQLGFGFQVWPPDYPGTLVCYPAAGNLEWDGGSWTATLQFADGAILYAYAYCGESEKMTVGFIFTINTCSLSDELTYDISRECPGIGTLSVGTQSDNSDCCDGIGPAPYLAEMQVSEDPVSQPFMGIPPKIPNCENDCECETPYGPYGHDVFNDLGPTGLGGAVATPLSTVSNQPVHQTVLTGGGGAQGCSGPICQTPPNSGYSSYPVNYGTGEIYFSETDIESNGYGIPWGHSRNFQSRLGTNATIGQGYNWMVEQWPFLSMAVDKSTIIVMGLPGSQYWFSKNESGGYDSDFDINVLLDHDETNGLFILEEANGTQTTFDDTTGTFRKRTAPGDGQVEVTKYASGGLIIEEVERTYTADGSTTTEQYLYEYTSPYADNLLSKVTLRRKVDSGSWENVQRASYTYYGPSESYGGLEDLKTVNTEEWDDSAWSDTGTSYYRYYPEYDGASSSSSAGGGQPAGWTETAHLPMYILGKAAFQRLKDDPGVTDPLTASNSTVALYADYYYEYDNDRRVTKEMVQGSSMTYLYSYTESTNPDGFNSWKTKTTETLPDGNQKIVFCNHLAQVMLTVLKSGSDEWISFRKYDDNGHLVLAAAPSAVTGYDENKADLLDYNSGTEKYTYLRDSAGLITTRTIDSASKYVSSDRVQEGQLGSLVKVQDYTYVACGGANGSSSSTGSSATGTGIIWYRSSLTQYPSSTDQTKKIITNYSYEWYSETCQVQQRTTTLPAIPTSQNGSGVSNSRKEYFDTYGNNTWSMDERGFISRTKFDIPTGAATQMIQDVDTSVETDAPTGWVTPSGGGLNLITDLEHDDQGRITQVLGPSHQVDLAGSATTVRRATWIVYDESATEDTTRIGQGYATGTSPSYTYTLINPVTISINDKNGKIQQQVQATRASTSGKLDPSDTFAQSTYTRWTTFQYTDCCNLASQRLYHDIPTSGSGSSGTNYDQTYYGYDAMKRRIRHVTPGGTITRSVFDARGLVTESWMGTDDNGATSSDPSGNGAPGNNMVILTANEYDDGNDGGDGNLTEQTQYADASDTRATTYEYDFRNRQTETDGEIDFFQKVYYDNIDRTTKTERYDTTSSGNLIARSESKYDDLSRVYQSVQYGVNPSTGVVGNSLTSNIWFDESGNTIKSLPAGSDLFTKTTYDSLGRRTKTYRGYDLDETTYADVFTVTGDTILEQSEVDYDDASNTIETRTRQRYHDAPASQTGELKNPSTTPKARVSYSAMYPDAIGRQQASANYGTNGGSTLSRSSTIPTRSDDILVNSMEYDDAGNQETMTDPSGMVMKLEYDDAGRETKKTMNYITSGSSTAGGNCQASDDTNIAVQTAYNADGNVKSITAENSITGNQTTEYVYGTTLSDSDVASSLLKRKEIYPDSVDSSDVILFAYNRQRQQTSVTDQNGTVHSYAYDKLGRQTQDRVTTLGTDVDGAVRRIAMSYEVQGMRENLTSYDHANVGSGSVVNDVEFAYNDFSQLTHDYQAHGGAVNTSTSPKVQYGYANGSANTVRPTTLTYPDGRVLNYDYGTSNGIDDAASRIGSLIDDDMAATHLVDYSYLGVGRAANSVNFPLGSGFVIADYTQPEIKWTMADLSGSNDPDTGDIYSGFDRFGRVKDNRWYGYGAMADADRIKYGYDRSSNRIWRQNTVADALSAHFDELYSNDGIQRLKDLERGTLNANKDAVTDETFAECWSLDPTGNWKKYLQDDDGDGTWDLEQARTANKVNEITDITETTGPSWVTPAYSKAGNMTTIPQPADPTSSYTATYDAWNRLVKLVDGANTVCEYEYDGAKRRTIQKSYVSGTLDETRHLYYTEPKKWQVIEERVDSSSDPEQQHIWGLRYIDDCVLRDRDTNSNGTLDERLYGMQDANWNVTALSNMSGVVQERYAYSAYGTPLFLTASFGSRAGSSYDWETLYAGYRWETGTDLFHVRNRALNSQIGNWLQRDLLVYEDTFNLYQYVASHPKSNVDPSGRALINVPYFCSFVNDPCFTAAMSCVCGLVGIADLIFGTLELRGVPIPIWLSRLFNFGDCACDLIGPTQQGCGCMASDYPNPGPPLISTILSLFSCTLNISGLGMSELGRLINEAWTFFVEEGFNEFVGTGGLLSGCSDIGSNVWNNGSVC